MTTADLALEGPPWVLWFLRRSCQHSLCKWFTTDLMQLHRVDRANLTLDQCKLAERLLAFGGFQRDLGRAIRVICFGSKLVDLMCSQDRQETLWRLGPFPVFIRQLDGKKDRLRSFRQSRFSGIYPKPQMQTWMANIVTPDNSINTHPVRNYTFLDCHEAAFCRWPPAFSSILRTHYVFNPCCKSVSSKSLKKKYL